MTTYPWTASQYVITDFSVCDKTGPPKQSLDGAPSRVRKNAMARATRPPAGFQKCAGRLTAESSNWIVASGFHGPRPERDCGSGEA